MTMTRDKIEELKRLAEKATPGEWKAKPFPYDYGQSGPEYCIIAGDAKVADDVPEDEAKFIAASNPQTILSLLALAERALEPQGQAHVISFKEEKHPTDGNMNRRYPVCSCGWKGVGSHSYNDDQYHQNQREADQHIAASQLALPAGPVPEGFVLVPMHLNAEMREVLSEEDWTWEDLLVAANAVTEEQYYAIQNGDDSSPAVAQPVADARAEYERMLRAGYQHDNVRRQERGLASTDELTEGQEREIAERVALKFPSGAGLRKDSPVAFSCARRAAHPTSWTMTCDKHCGDDAKCFRAALCQPAEEGGKS